MDSTTREHINHHKVVIIGAGAGGAFAAMTLAEAGIEVVVVERGYHHSNSTMPKDLAGAVANLFTPKEAFAQPMGHLLFPSQEAKA